MAITRFLELYVAQLMLLITSRPKRESRWPYNGDKQSIPSHGQQKITEYDIGGNAAASIFSC